MGENSGSDTFRFQGQAVSDAVDVLDEYRGIDRDELGRRGVTEILREVTTPEEKAAVFAQYQRSDFHNRFPSGDFVISSGVIRGRSPWGSTSRDIGAN